MQIETETLRAILNTPEVHDADFGIQDAIDEELECMQEAERLRVEQDRVLALVKHTDMRFFDLRDRCRHWIVENRVCTLCGKHV